jgi:hypothetical protein
VLALWAFALIYAAIAGGTTRYRKTLNRLRELEKQMGKARRHRKEMRTACDLITQVMEDAAFEGRISDATKEFVYKQLSDKLYDLRHPSFIKQTGNLKEDIRARLGPEKVATLRKPNKTDNNLVYLKGRKKTA